MARAVVIGAGVAGLAAAARLARLRHDVVVCEAGAAPGGQAGTFSREGFTFDTGPGLLTLPAAYRDLFVKTGKTVPLEQVLDLEPVDPAVRWRFADGSTVDVPNATRAGMVEAFTAAFGRSGAAGWDDFLSAGAAVWEPVRLAFYTAPPSTRTEARATPEGRARLAALTPARSLEALVKDHIRDKRLRRAAADFASWAGSDPGRTAAAAAVLPYVEHAFGVWRVVGGVHRLVRVVADRAELRGAKLRFGAPVEAVLVEAGRVAGVRLAGGEAVPADLVVAAVDAALLYDGLLPAGGGPRVVAGEPGEPSASAFTVLLALRGREETPRRTVLHCADPGDAAKDTFGRRARPPAEPTLHLLSGDPAGAPEGHEARTLTAIVPRHGSGPGALDWHAPGVAEAYADHLLAELARRGDDVRRRLLWRAWVSPADLEARTGAPGGSLAGAALHGDAALFRPPTRTAVPGLFHVGATAHPGPGLSSAILGTALLADMVGRA